MADPPLNDPAAGDDARLADLQAVLDSEIPMAASMGVCVESAGDPAAPGLVVSMPLDRNRNHQQTAFAGSLNALCTLTGWGRVFLELRRLESDGAIVIRRSTIKYHCPVDSPVVRARCLPLDAERQAFFREMLLAKGQTKLDLEVQIDDGSPGSDRPAVAFQGSYVVLRPGESGLDLEAP